MGRLGVDFCRWPLPKQRSAGRNEAELHPPGSRQPSSIASALEACAGIASAYLNSAIPVTSVVKLAGALAPAEPDVRDAVEAGFDSPTSYGSAWTIWTLFRSRPKTPTPFR
jgi:hypothetical protein